MIEVYKFWASWCGPCISYAPTFTQVRNELESENIKFHEIDVDKQESKELLSTFNIKSIPTTLVIKGQDVKNISGAISKEELKEFILNQ